MKKILAAWMLFLVGVFFVLRLDAATINPASNATADSDNTAGTIVYRDSSGNFAAGTITATLSGSASGATLTATTGIRTATVTATSNVEVWGKVSVTGAGGISDTYGLSAGSITIGTNDLVTDAANNRVGIQTASPATTLDVVGSVQIGATSKKSTFTTGGDLTLPYGITAATIAIGTNDLFSDYTNNRIGIQTVTPATTLDVVGDAQFGSGATKSTISAYGALTIPYNVSAGSLTVGTNDLMTDAPNNRVGIQTVLPASTLHVNGSAQIGSGATTSTFTATGYFLPRRMALATIVATTPDASEVGGLIVCTDCAAAYSVCVATAATVQGFSLVADGAAGCN